MNTPHNKMVQTKRNRMESFEKVQTHQLVFQMFPIILMLFLLENLICLLDLPVGICIGPLIVHVTPRFVKIY